MVNHQDILTPSLRCCYILSHQDDLGTANPWRSAANSLATNCQPFTSTIAAIAASDDASDIDIKYCPTGALDMMASSSSFSSDGPYNPCTPVDTPASPRSSSSSMFERDNEVSFCEAAGAATLDTTTTATAAAAVTPAAAAAAVTPFAAAAVTSAAAAAAKPAKKGKKATVAKASARPKGSRSQPSRTPDCLRKDTASSRAKKQETKQTKDDTNAAGTKPKWVPF
jgi:hypothetical protein